MNYSLRELECFTAVAEELSFTRAAKRLALAQPPLSRHIRALEEKMGTRLFERDQHRVGLTPAGVIFLEETRGILPQLQRAGDAVHRAARGEVVRLRLGFVSAVLNPELVGVLQRFRALNPNVQISLQDAAPSEQLAAIAEGRLDGGFVGLLPAEHPSKVHFTPWRKEALRCFLPAGHRLAEKARLSLAELAAEAFVAVSSSAAPAFAAYWQRLCREAGFRPRIVLESPRAQAVAVMVAAGSGVALLPESLAHLMGDAVVVCPVKGSPEITHVFAHAPGPATPAVRDLLRLLQQK